MMNLEREMIFLSRIVALVSKRKKSESLVDSLLKKLQHPGNQKTKTYSMKGAVLGQNYFASEKSVEFDYDAAVVANSVILSEKIDNTKPQAVIYRLYQQYGEDMVKKLDGGFAFIVADNKGKVFAARDPMGLKPLYYAMVKDDMVFASEIKALIGLNAKINVFPPGYFYKTGYGFIKYSEFMNSQPTEVASQKKAISKIRQTLISSIAMNSRNASNLGIYLSGGLDSSIIAAAAQNITDQFKTFCVGIENSPDLLKARTVARYIGSEHYEYVYTLKEMLEILPQVIYFLESFDMYLVRSAIANFMLSRMAYEAGIDIVLCGEGSDELFGGYQYLKSFDLSDVEPELVKLTLSSHANGFQRADRMTSAFSIDARLPFMSKRLIELAHSIPGKWKIYDTGREKIEKWILRKAFEHDLPQEIVWRTKQKFSQGTGSAEMIRDYAEQKITDEEFLKHRHIRSDFQLRSKEEMLYYLIFKEFFPKDSVLDTIGRTATIG
jgi:asparagine synthase (glutamine-hydrolysing)